jgi:UDP-N-acetylglucosamine 3-dehydrogenase
MVGLGAMGQNHLRVLSSFAGDGVSVAAAVDPDAARRERVLQGLAGARGYASLEEALASEQLDFACIATPIGHLADAATCALQAGLHVLVEKPMAADRAQAERLIAQTCSPSQVFAVGLVERCNPAVRALKERLVAGQIGHVLQMHARRLSPFPSRAAMAGVAADLATHDIDVMRYLTGAEIERVYAETASAVGDSGEDLVCATMRFDNGMTGLLESNWISPTKVRQLAVTGDRGMFVVDYLTQDLTFFGHPTKANVWSPLAGLRGGGEGDMIRYALNRSEPLRNEWEGFLAAASNGAGPPATSEDGLAAVSVAEAIRLSGELLEPVVPERQRPAEISLA